MKLVVILGILGLLQVKTDAYGSLPCLESNLVIEPEQYYDSVYVGDTIRYPFDVINNGENPQCPTIDYIFWSSAFAWQYWEHWFISSNGKDSLWDTDGDDFPDIGTILPGDTGRFYVDVICSDELPRWYDSKITIYVGGFDFNNPQAVVFTEPILSSIQEESQAGHPIDIAIIGRTIYILSERTAQKTFLELFDATGRKILSQAITEPQTAINVSDLSQGVYFVSAKIGESKRLVRKVVIY